MYTGCKEKDVSRISVDGIPYCTSQYSGLGMVCPLPETKIGNIFFDASLRTAKNTLGNSEGGV